MIVINVKDKNNAEGDSNLRWVVRNGPAKKMTFEQRPKEIEGTNRTNIWRKIISESG